MTPGTELSALPVVVLCGGRGRRLRPRTDVVPKALVEVAGRPILEHILERFRSRGLRRFVLCVGYQADRIRERFAQAPAGCTVAFSDAGEEAGMLSRLHAAGTLVASRFLLSYCDTFIDLDVAALLGHHEAMGAAATIVTAKITSPFGLVRADEARWVTSFQEKPILDYYIGCALLERAALEQAAPAQVAMPDGQGFVAFVQTLAAAGRLAAFEHLGLQATFNTEPELREAEQVLGRFYTYREER